MNVYGKMFKHHFPNGYVDHDTFWHRVYHVLSPGERAILLANQLYGEYHNGGFAQYFSNGNYEHAHEAVRLLRRVGNHLDDVIARDHNEEFSRPLWEKCAKFGIQGLPIPVEYGGGGADTAAGEARVRRVGGGALRGRVGGLDVWGV